MRFLTLLATILLFVAFSHAFSDLSDLDIDSGISPLLESRDERNGTRTGKSIKRTCRQMSKLQKLTRLAANQTRLDAMIEANRLTTAQADALKAKAAEATTKLETLQSNATLVEECAVVNAHRKDVRQCKTLGRLEKLTTLANNQTAMDAFVQEKKLNETQVEKLQEKISKATTRLQEMQSNATLSNFCAQEQQQRGSAGESDPASGTSGAEQAAVSGITSSASVHAVQTVPLVLAVAVMFATL